jgi:hypothetical protein
MTSARSSHRSMGIEITMVEARTLAEVDAAFQKQGTDNDRAVLMLPTTSRDAQGPHVKVDRKQGYCVGGFVRDLAKPRAF